MTYDDLLDAIARSSRDDWLCDDRGRRWTYKGDLLLRIEDAEPYGEGEDARQTWASRVLGKTAASMRFTVSYGTSWVMDVPMVAVNDDGTFIPYPDSPDCPVITAWQYTFATIVAGRAATENTLDAWLRKGGITVHPSGRDGLLSSAGASPP